MNNQEPIKRHDALRVFSVEHHYALLLCWKIKTGFAKNVSPERIKAYTDWFYKNHLIPHFVLEEKYIFPILPPKNELVKQALEEHKQLKKLFTAKTNIEKSLKQIQKELDKHVRFEERILFKEIEAVATAEELEKIKEIHGEEKFKENKEDVFWM